MKHGDRTLICTLAVLAWCIAAQAVTSDSPGSPYQGIVERNVFGLKPPAPPPDPEANKPAPPRILLQGITTFGGTKRVLFKMQVPPKAGDPGKGEQSFILAEGQRDGDIEVLEIDPAAGTVKVKNFGTVMNLNFADNGIKTTAAAGPSPAPRPVGFVPPPAASPFTPAGAAPSLARPMRLPTPTGTAVPAANTPVYATGAPAYGGSTPGFPTGGASVPLYGSTPAQVQPQPQAAASPTSQLSAEEQLLLVEANRARLKQQGLEAKFPPIPATPLTSTLNPGAAGTTGTEGTPPATTTRPNWPPRAPSLSPLLPQ